jgi:hypothetical protein
MSEQLSYDEQRAAKRKKLEKKMTRRRAYELPDLGEVVPRLMDRPEGLPL